MTAYFDNAATTFPKPEEVYCFMDSFYRECGVNVGRGQHKLAAKAAALVAETRKLLLELNHCPNKAVVFTPTATEALNIILQGTIHKDGMNIFLSPFEHNAVTRVVNHLSEVYNLNVSELSVDRETLLYDTEKISRQFARHKPDIIVVSHASNVCGTVAPVAKICDLSKQHGATTIVDMCQTMGLIDTDLNTDNIDYAVFAAHKTLYGSLGLGGFICKPEAKPEPLIYGGTGVDSANPLQPETIPDRYEVGSLNIQAVAGLNASLKWLQRTSISEVFAVEQLHRQKLIDLLNGYENIKVIAPADSKQGIGVVSAVFEGYSADNIGQILSDHDIAVRTGLHCAPNAHRYLGTFPAGTVRFSVGYFNTESDFEMLADALDYIADNS